MYNVFSENTPLKKCPYPIFLDGQGRPAAWGRLAGGRGTAGGQPGDGQGLPAAWGRLAGGRGRLFITFAPPPDAREAKSILWLAENAGRVVKY